MFDYIVEIEKFNPCPAAKIGKVTSTLMAKTASAEVAIAKADDDKRLVFSWASIARLDGEQIEDM